MISAVDEEQPHGAVPGIGILQDALYGIQDTSAGF